MTSFAAEEAAAAATTTGAPRVFHQKSAYERLQQGSNKGGELGVGFESAAPPKEEEKKEGEEAEEEAEGVSEAALFQQMEMSLYDVMDDGSCGGDSYDSFDDDDGGSGDPLDRMRRRTRDLLS